MGEPKRYLAYPWLAALALVGLWQLATAAGWFAPATLPSPAEVLAAFRQQIPHGRLLDDVVASLYRVSIGFVLAAVLAVPIGLMLGNVVAARATFLPIVNFFRSLSPIAWIPFAILWFGIGDRPAIFIIFIATFFQLVLATMAAVAAVPKIYYRVAKEHGLEGPRLLVQVTLMAIMPELIRALRIAAGVAWMVVVAAEMIAVPRGLGSLIIDARNGLRMDLVVVAMVVIGAIGIILDRLLVQLTRVKSVRWGYER